MERVMDPKQREQLEERQVQYVWHVCMCVVEEEMKAGKENLIKLATLPY